MAMPSKTKAWFSHMTVTCAYIIAPAGGDVGRGLPPSRVEGQFHFNSPSSGN